MEQSSIWLDDSSLKLSVGRVGVAVMVTIPQFKFAVLFDRTEDEREVTYGVKQAIIIRDGDMLRPIFDQRFKQFLSSVGWKSPTTVLLDHRYPEAFTTPQMVVGSRLDAEIKAILKQAPVLADIRKRVEANDRILGNMATRS